MYAKLKQNLAAFGLALAIVLFAVEMRVPIAGASLPITTNRLGLAMVLLIALGTVRSVRVDPLIRCVLVTLWVVVMWAVASLIVSPYLGMDGGASVVFVIPWVAAALVCLVAYNIGHALGHDHVRSTLRFLVPLALLTHVFTWSFVLGEVGVGGLKNPWLVRAAFADFGPGLNRHLNGLFTLSVVSLAMLLGVFKAGVFMVVEAAAVTLSMLLLAALGGSRQTLVAVVLYCFLLLLITNRRLLGRRGLVVGCAIPSVAGLFWLFGRRIDLWSWMNARFVRVTQDQYVSGSERIEILQNGLQVIKDNPLLGVGAGAFRMATGSYADNGYLAVAAELGVFPAAILGLAIVSTIFVTYRRRRSVHFAARDAHEVLWAFVVVFGIVSATFNEVLADLALWACIGLLVFISGREQMVTSAVHENKVRHPPEWSAVP